MPLPVFPTCQFGFNSIEPRIANAVIDGGTSLSGLNTVIATDGGGKVVLEMAGSNLLGRQKIMLWRAIATRLQMGAVPVIVPLCNARFQPTLGKKTVPHSDQTTFSDETEYAQWDCVVKVGAAAPLRSTTLVLDIQELGRPLIGGEWFSIDHPTLRHRAYNIWSIDAMDDTSATIRFFPPLREAVTVGEGVEFAIPRCVMRLVGEMRAAPTLNYASGDVSFIEDFSGVYE